MRDYRKIEAWKLADDLTVGIYERPDLLLCDDSSCKFCTTWRRPTIAHVRRSHPII